MLCGGCKQCVTQTYRDKYWIFFLAAQLSTNFVIVAAVVVLVVVNTVELKGAATNVRNGGIDSLSK